MYCYFGIGLNDYDKLLGDIMKDKKEKLMTDGECLKQIQSLLILQKFTYNKDIIESLDLVIWQLIIDQLKK